MELLTARQVTFAYKRGVNALDDVDLQVQAGEIVGLIGANGSGKSTFIQLVFDLLRAQGGTVSIAGRPNNELSAKLSAMYLPSEDLLPEFLTGLEYLRLVYSMYKEPFDTSEVEQQLRKFSMLGRENDLIEDYSHGMRKKLQVISALLLDRPLLAIDETLNGIDLEALNLVEHEFRRLRSTGTALLLCTHDFDLLARLADRIVLLAHGTVLVDSTIDDIRTLHGSIHEMVSSLLFREVG